MTGTGTSSQPWAARWNQLGTGPCSGSISASDPGWLAITPATSSPEQKLGPSPCRTTARTPGSTATRAAAAVIASNIATSSALCLSGRLRVTVATWSETSIETRSCVWTVCSLIAPKHYPST